MKTGNRTLSNVGLFPFKLSCRILPQLISIYFNLCTSCLWNTDPITIKIKSRHDTTQKLKAMLKKIGFHYYRLFFKLFLSLQPILQRLSWSMESLCIGTRTILWGLTYWILYTTSTLTRSYSIRRAA